MFKKILASALAVAMLAGMSVTAFADQIPALSELDKGDLYFANGVNGGTPSSNIVHWYIVDEDNIVEDEYGVSTQLLDIEDIKLLQAGDKIVARLAMIEEEATDVAGYMTTLDIRKSDVSRWKADIIWDTDEGEDLVEDITIEPFTFGGDGLGYGVAIQIKEDVEVDYADFVGRLQVYKNRSNPTSEMQLNADQFATRGYGVIGFDDSGFEEVYAEGFSMAWALPGTNDDMYKDFPVRNFDAADANDRASMYFVGIGYYHTRVIDTEGEKYMAFNTVPNMEIEEANPKAHIDYVNFPGNVKFHQFGVMELFMEEGQYIYAMEDGMIYTLEDFAKMQRENQELIYDEDDLTVSFQMNNYPDTFIYSDMELVMEEEVEEAEKEIPETGGVLAQ